MKKETIYWIFLVFGAFLFSCCLMWQTFSYDASSSSMLIAPKAWSDFGAHIPLIRSFSLGNNWPPESPLFPGSPIQYHFLFYFLVGMLEKAGVRIDMALNVPSILGMTALIVFIVIMAKKIFHSLSVGVIAALLFCLNSSLSFLRFFEKYPLSIHTFRDIVTNSAFPAFGPWDGGLVSAFWTMNIYTNQRHLALSYAIVLGILLILFQANKRRGKQNILMQTGSIALCMSILLFTNQAAALIAFIWLIWLFIYQKQSRVPLALAAFICIPSAMLYTHLIAPSGTVAFDPGYLVKNPLTVQTVTSFWWNNLGISLLMIPFGFIVAPKQAKLFFGIPLLALFVIPNLWRFSPDMINNHKFFNFLIIMANMLSAYGLVWLWKTIKTHTNHLTLRVAGCGIVGILFFFLTFSGLIDLFPIFNEKKGSLADIGGNDDVAFFLYHTHPDDIILNSTWFYHPASIAGRKIFSGYTYFTWSYGYNQGKREAQQKVIYEATTKQQACYFLRAYNIAYVELADAPEHFLTPNYALFQNEFAEVYRNQKTGVSVYDTTTSCVHYETTN